MFGKFLLSPISGYIAVGMIALVLVLSASLWFTNNRLEKAQEKIVTVRAELAQAKVETDNIRKAAEQVNEDNLKTIATCQEINAQNAAQRDQVKQRADDAVAKVREFERKLKTQEARYEVLSTQLRTIDDPLSGDLTGWLCSPGINCADRNPGGTTGQGSDRAGAQGVDGADTGAATNPSTRRLAEVYRQTVSSLMLCNDRLVRISELVQ